MKRFRCACRSPSLSMKVDVDVQRALGFSGRRDAIEPHVERFWKLPKVADDILADALAQRRQIRFPSMSTEIDVRADVALLFRNCPPPAAQLLSKRGSSIT